MNALEIILTILEVIASIALIGVVLLQSGKNSGLGTISGNNDNYMSKGMANGLDKVLANSTKWIAGAWLLLTLSLSLIGLSENIQPQGNPLWLIFIKECYL